MKEFLAKDANGHDIYRIVDDAHMQAHTIALSDIKEAIEKAGYEPPFGMLTVDLGRTVGPDNCIKTNENDRVENMIRKGRKAESRIVFGKAPEPTSKLTIGICKDDDGLQTLFTAFTGELAPKELSDPRLTDEERPAAEAFWTGHALVCQPEELEDSEKARVIVKIEEMRKSLMDAGYYTKESIDKICELEQQYLDECEEIAAECQEEGYPSHGDNYDLRCESRRALYDEQIAFIDADEESRHISHALDEIRKHTGRTDKDVYLEECGNVLLVCEYGTDTPIAQLDEYGDLECYVNGFEDLWDGQVSDLDHDAQDVCDDSENHDDL